jgi:hypothetical protein
MKMLGGNKSDGESHVAAPAASAANKGKTTKAKQQRQAQSLNLTMDLF